MKKVTYRISKPFQGFWPRRDLFNRNDIEATVVKILFLKRENFQFRKSENPSAA